MKRTVIFAFTFVATVGTSVLGTSLTTAQQAGQTKTPSFSDRTSLSPYFDSLAWATAGIKRLKLDFKESPDKAAARADREKVEVLARSITFPEVLNQGELMISAEFQNATLLCLDAALYAGRVEGLILAMDRETVMEHKLYWTIDAAGDLFNTCLEVFLLEAYAGQTRNNRNQLKEVKEELGEQIQMIQQALRYARNVKIKAAAQKGVSCDLEEVFWPGRRVKNSDG